MRISPSSLNLWLECQQKWGYVYLDNLEPTFTPEYLNIGHIIHRWLERYYKGMQAIEARDATWEEALGTTLKEVTEVARIKAMLWGISAGYPERYKTEEFQVLSVEVPSKTDPYDIVIPDVIIKKPNGEVWVLEHKITTQSNTDKYIKHIGIHPQPHAEVEAAKAVGICYNFIYKAEIRQKQTENLDEYCVRMATEYTNPDKHPRYYQRSWIYIPHSHTVNERASEEAIRMKMSKPGDKLQRNPHACFNYGSECAFLPLCQGVSSEGLYRTREDRSLIA